MRPVDTTATARTASDVSGAVSRLVPTISARASEIEAARRLPDDLLAGLKEAGCLRMLLPPSHGGLGVTLPDAMGVYEALSCADASVAWTVANCSGAWCDFAGLDRAAFDAVFSAGVDVTVAGVFAPSGVAERVDGGYRVSGRWGFASGCQHCDWLFGNCLEDVDGERRMRTVVFALSEITIEDTWTVSGLCGTGSHHFTADEVFVPITRTCATLEAEPCVDVPSVHIPTPPLFALAITSIALGVAQGALDDILAHGGRQDAVAGGRPTGRQPVVPTSAGQCGHRTAGRPRAGLRRSPLDLGDRRRPDAVHHANTAPGSARPRRGRLPARRPSSTSLTTPAVEVRCTPGTPCSAGCATSMPSPSTSSSNPTH